MAIDPTDLGNKGVESAAKMKEVLQTAEASANNIRSSFDQQLKIVTQLRNTMVEVCNIMDSCGKATTEQGNILSDNTWKKFEKQVNDSSFAQKKYTATAGKTNQALQAGDARAQAAAMAIQALGQAFRNLYAIAKSVVGIIGSVTKTVFNFTKALVLAPFRIIDWLFDKSKGATDTSLATAIENVREQFGSLKSESSRTVIDVAKGMGKLNDTGVSAYRIFGTVAQRVEAVNKMATAMGATFQVFGKEIMANGEAIMRYNKGLGITDEQMAFIASTAMRMGKDIAQVQNEMTKQALGMSKAFGVNAKVISRDMAKAMQDLAHFGHLSTKEIAVAATFANKLGVSVDKLTGILDATKTFDNTAEQISKLNEQFNLNLDAQEIMLEENPAAALAKIQGAFAAAGHDVSKMNRFQRELIKSTGFMSDELLNASLSTKGMGVSFDKVSKQGDKNEQKVMSQTEAMKELADSMKRIVQAGQTTKGGILDHIIEGFSRGIQSAPEFIRLMENMNQILVSALEFGVKLGKDFVEFFPGVKDMIGGLAEIFDPRRYQNMFNGVLKAFDVFKAGGSGKMEDFMARLEVIFDQFFKAGSPGMNRIIKGIQAFGGAVIAGVSKLIVWVTDELAKALPKMFEFLLNPKMDLKKPDAGPWAKMLAPLGDAIMRAIDILGPILEKGFIALWDKYWPKLQEWLGKKFFQLLNFFQETIIKIGEKLSKFIEEKLGAGFAKDMKMRISGYFQALGGLVDLIIALFDGNEEKIIAAAKKFSEGVWEHIIGHMLLVSRTILTLGPKLFEYISKALGWVFDKVGDWFLSLKDLPIVGPIFELIGKVSKSFGDYFKKVGEMFNAFVQFIRKFDVIAFLKDVWSAVTSFFKKVAAAVLEFMSPVLKFFAGAGKTILSYIEPVITEVVRYFTDRAYLLFEALITPFKGLVDFFKKLFLADVSGAFSTLGESIKTSGIKILEWTLYPFVRAYEWIQRNITWDSIGKFFSNVWEGIKSFGQKFLDVIAWPFKQAWEAIKKVFNWDTMKEVFFNVVAGIKEALGKIADIGPFKALIEIAKKVFKIESPSRVFAEIGRFVHDGFMKSVEKIPKSTQEVLKETTDAAAKDAKFVGAQAASPVAAAGNLPSATPAAAAINEIDAMIKKLNEVKEATEKNNLVDVVTTITNNLSKLTNAGGGRKPLADLLAAARGVNHAATPDEWKESIDSLKQISSVIDEIVNLNNRFSTVKKANENDEFMQSVYVTANSLQRMTADFGQNPLESIIVAATKIGTTMDQFNSGAAIVSLQAFNAMMKDLVELNDKINSIKQSTENDNFMKSIWTTITNLTRLTADSGQNPLELLIKSSVGIGKLATAEATRQVTTSIKAVTEMVKTIQQLDDALSKLPTVNMEARLEKLAASSGLGAGGVYTVKSREVVMNFDIKITMDAGKLEEVMIFRKESIIRDRLNYALGDGSGANQVANNISLRLNDRRPTPIASNVD